MVSNTSSFQPCSTPYIPCPVASLACLSPVISPFNMDRSTADRISAARTDLQRICDLLEQSSANFDQYVSVARSIIRQLTRAHFLQSPLLFGEQAWFISKLQQIAYHDADSGAVQDIAEWCVGQWLQILQSDSENLDALLSKPFLRRTPIFSRTMLTILKIWVIHGCYGLSLPLPESTVKKEVRRAVSVAADHPPHMRAIHLTTKPVMLLGRRRRQMLGSIPLIMSKHAEFCFRQRSTSLVPSESRKKGMRSLAAY